MAYLQNPWVIMAINGLIAGWLAGLLLGGGGLIRNLIVGVIGAIIGGALVQMGLLNLPFDLGSWGNQIVVSTIGAILVVLIARLIAR
ncbi:MAG: GlsB/YeaQ/YmgE family stress response membrane protein [Hyphomicrobiaceae bacterium]|nr:GlsB/YeaQ/YmgE family stress response membrane protein [Hyphomicrobiaceae bacterium]MCC0008520.1 GlsB/YeaQ/YmgE family stress response membrane protein [Hyphomicrobiaceae bacterium]